MLNFTRFTEWPKCDNVGPRGKKARFVQFSTAKGAQFSGGAVFLYIYFKDVALQSDTINLYNKNISWLVLTWELTGAHQVTNLPLPREFDKLLTQNVTCSASPHTL